MAFERVRCIKGGKGSKFGSIGKDGRLIVPHLVVSAANASPGMYFELLVDRDNLQILARPTPVETVYSVKSTCTGKPDEWGKPDEKGRTSSLIISLRSALTQMGVTVVRRLRVRIEWSLELEGIVVFLPAMETVGSDLAAEAS